jgi:uncharacterized protein (UPF0332 family)
VNDNVQPYLTKASECLAGARSELANARYNNAANRAYYAAYNAAIVALIRAGRSSRRWDHDEVQAIFAGQLVYRRKLYPTNLRSTLSDLTTMRMKGDYGLGSVSERDANRAIEWAERFLSSLLGIDP